MFSRLPQLFDRNFAIGHFLPLATFVLALIAILDAFNVNWVRVWTTEDKLLVGATFATFLTWLGSIILLLLNRSIIRFFEGYGFLGWLWLPLVFQRIKLSNILARKEIIAREWHAYEARDESIPASLQNEWMRLQEQEANYFPSDKNDLLPTGFGNVIRAFETYPNVMYGIDGIDGWFRLLFVLNKECRELIDSAKSTLDFWINLSLLSIIIFVVFFVIAYSQGQYFVVFGVEYWEGGASLPLLLIPLLALLIAFFSYCQSKKAAMAWGNFVKAAFDVSIPELTEKLGYSSPTSETFWRDFSRAVAYRIPEALPRRSRLS